MPQAVPYLSVQLSVARLSCAWLSPGGESADKLAASRRLRNHHAFGGGQSKYISSKTNGKGESVEEVRLGDRPASKIIFRSPVRHGGANLGRISGADVVANCLYASALQARLL